MAEENVKIDRIIDEQGRRIETHSYETIVDGQKERVIETHVEQVPMVIQERVVEKIAPVVTTRKKEVFKDGKVVDSTVEELDHNTMKMSVTPVAVTSNSLTKEDLVEVIRSVATPSPNVLTKKDLIEALNEVMKPLFREEPKPEIKLKTIKKPIPVEEIEEEEEVVVKPIKKKAVQISEEAPVKENGWASWVELGTLTLLSGQLAFVFYYLVLKNWL